MKGARRSGLELVQSRRRIMCAVCERQITNDLGNTQLLLLQKKKTSTFLSVASGTGRGTSCPNSWHQSFALFLAEEPVGEVIMT